jgi:hypothetical protein
MQNRFNDGGASTLNVECRAYSTDEPIPLPFKVTFRDLQSKFRKLQLRMDRKSLEDLHMLLTELIGRK